MTIKEIIAAHRQAIEMLEKLENDINEAVDAIDKIVDSFEEWRAKLENNQTNA